MTGKRYQSRYPVRLLQPSGTANRAVQTTDGVLMTMGQVSSSMVGVGVATRAATRYVAAVGASPTRKADYYCDGVADDVEINAALASLPSVGGTVVLSEGTFTLAAPVRTTAARQILRGQGMGITVLKVVDGGGAPVNTVIVQSLYDYNEISDLTIDGNRTNNTGAAANNLMGYQMFGSRSALIRVQITEVNIYGLITSNTCGFGVVRDCLVHQNNSNGAIFKAAAGQPLVVEGCTFRGNGANGVICDDGPVLMSDCAARGNTAAGFLVGTDNVALTNCYSESNSGNGFNANVANTPNTAFVGCRALDNSGDPSFGTSGLRTRFVGCVASMASGSGLTGFTSASPASDVEVIGCSAFGGGRGYLHTSTGRVSYVGCQVITNGFYGIHVTTGEMQARGCRICGTGGGSYGVVLEVAGVGHSVEGCRATNHQGSGLYVDSRVSNVRFVNNYVRDVSPATNNTSRAITANAPEMYIDGNVVRDPASGNRPFAAIGVGGTDSQVGVNDMFRAGVSAELSDGGVRTRRLAKIQLAYTPASDVIGAQQAANAWFDLLIPPNSGQFRVDHADSIVEISCRGVIQGGASGTPCQHMLRWVLDAAGSTQRFLVGGNVTEVAGGYQNPLAGGQSIKIRGLTVGTHTIKLQGFNWGANSYWYLRPSSFAYHEYFSMQIVEYQ